MKKILIPALSAWLFVACNTPTNDSESTKMEAVSEGVTDEIQLDKTQYVEEEFQYLLDLNLSEKPSEFYLKMPSGTKSLWESNTMKYMLDADFYHQLNFHTSGNSTYQIVGMIDFSSDTKRGETVYFNVRKYLFDKFQDMEPEFDEINDNTSIYHASWSTDFVEGGYTEYQIRFINKTLEFNITSVSF
jgi:hypothetical protein